MSTIDRLQLVPQEAPNAIDSAIVKIAEHVRGNGDDKPALNLAESGDYLDMQVRLGAVSSQEASEIFMSEHSDKEELNSLLNEAYRKLLEGHITGKSLSEDQMKQLKDALRTDFISRLQGRFEQQLVADKEDIRHDNGLSGPWSTEIISTETYGHPAVSETGSEDAPLTLIFPEDKKPKVIDLDDEIFVQGTGGKGNTDSKVAVEPVHDDEIFITDNPDTKNEAKNTGITANSLLERGKSALDTLKDRVSLTFKETRKSYRHYKKMQSDVATSEPGAERTKALQAKEIAKRDFRNRIARTTGALVMGSLGFELVTDQDYGHALGRGLGAAAVGIAAAVGFEAYKQGKEKVSEASVSLSARATNRATQAMEWVGDKLQNLSLPDSLKERQMLGVQELGKIISKLPEEEQKAIRQNNEVLDSFEDAPDFDPQNPDYQAVLKSQNHLLEQLNQEYGTEKIKRSVKIAAGIGIVATAASAIYLSKYGLHLPHAKSGNHNNLIDSATKGAGKPKGGSHTKTIAEQIGMPSSVSPKNHDAIIKATEKIQKIHDVKIGSTEFNKISENTFKLAAKKEQFLGGTKGAARAQQGRIFDHNFAAWVDHMEKAKTATEEASKLAN